MDFSALSNIPSHGVVDPLMSETHQQWTQADDPVLLANFNNFCDSILGADEDSKAAMSYPSPDASRSMASTSFMGMVDFGRPLSMDVPETETTAMGRRSRRHKRRARKARARATADHAIVEEKCRDDQCRVCRGFLAPREGTWQVCPKCTYALLNRPEQPNPLFRIGGRAAFQRVYPEEDLPASDIDTIAVVSEALYATYSHYLKEEFALHANDGLKQEQLQPLIQNNAAKRAYPEFGMRPPIVSGAVKADDMVGMESESDWSEWCIPEEAGPSTRF
ncbi:hypothetical protein IW261DRAFT_1597992 [Armillaria novae-zelandiae]|uniref:Uncharacterized protein n=1 Tax=Armillaria novae-zelandiae TaxID=153914 RepID=A0AA39NNI9_9AGAR|nr:hypothetical protein IW261DRAFT_1597992 [Armillaria novae-zelandiae]